MTIRADRVDTRLSTRSRVRRFVLVTAAVALGIAAVVITFQERHDVAHGKVESYSTFPLPILFVAGVIALVATVRLVCYQPRHPRLGLALLCALIGSVAATRALWDTSLPHLPSPNLAASQSPPPTMMTTPANAAPPSSGQATHNADNNDTFRKDPTVVALLGGREIEVNHVGPWNIGGTQIGAQITVTLTEGPADISGLWPHVVIENPAPCETCKVEGGKLHWHTETKRQTEHVDGLLINFETTANTVREVIPLLNGVPTNAPRPPLMAGQ